MSTRRSSPSTHEGTGVVDLAEKRASEEREASIQATKREIEQLKKANELQMERERAQAVEQLKGRGCRPVAANGMARSSEESGGKGQRSHHWRVYHKKARREKDW